MPIDFTTIDLTTIPPGEEYKWRVKIAELGIVIGARGKLTVTQKTDGGRNVGTIGPYKALPIVHEGLRLVKKLREQTDKYRSLLPPAWPNEDHEALDRILKKLEQSFGVLRESEERLKRLGCKFSPAGKPRRASKGHVGRDDLYEMVWGTYISLQRKPEFTGEGNTFKIRRKIAEELVSQGFTKEELDARGLAKNPIYSALRHRLERG